MIYLAYSTTLVRERLSSGLEGPMLISDTSDTPLSFADVNWKFTGYLSILIISRSSLGLN